MIHVLKWICPRLVRLCPAPFFSSNILWSRNHPQAWALVYKAENAGGFGKRLLTCSRSKANGLEIALGPL